MSLSMYEAGRSDAAPGEGVQTDALDVLLERLTAAPGLSGREDAPARLVADLWSPQCDRVWRDPLGSCAGWLSCGLPDAPRVALVAHLDAIGCLVRRLEGGFLRLAAVGGVDARQWPGRDVVVWASGGALPGVVGTVPPHLTRAEDRRRATPLEELWVDVGLPEAEVTRRVRPGDPVSLQAPLCRLQGGLRSGGALDNRAGVASLCEALRLLHGRRRSADVLLVASVQEEVGLVGAAASAFGLAPEVAVAVDVGFARQPGVGEAEGLPAGRGPVVARGANFHPAVVASLLEVARREGVPHQGEAIAGSSGTDAWAIQVARGGIPVGLCSIPLRYMHGPAETVHGADVREAARLLAAWAAQVDRGFVEGLSRVLK
jgi:putative aminopeptidase FrvX